MNEQRELFRRDTSTEVERLTEQLSFEYSEQFDRDTIETVVRADFARWSGAPIQDFVPIFVERKIRERLRRTG